LQGNFDPARLYSSPEVIQTMVWDMIDAFGKDRYVVNLGHGILPDIPVDHVRAFVGAVKSYSPKS
jgi:uroporphyrinogen decarboxylase